MSTDASASGSGGVVNPGAESSSGTSGSSTPAAVTLYNELVQEREALRRMRVVSSLTLLAIFIVYTCFIGLRISRFNHAKFGSALQQKLIAMSPEIRETVTRSVRDNWDDAKIAVRQVVRKRMPWMQMAVNREYKALRESLLRRLQEKLLDELTRQLDQRSDLVLKEFPELANDDKRAALLKRVRVLARNTAERVVAKDMADCRRSLDSIEITLARKDVRRRIELLKSDPRLREKTIGYVMAVMARPMYEGKPEAPMGDLGKGVVGQP